MPSLVNFPLPILSLFPAGAFLFMGKLCQICCLLWSPVPGKALPESCRAAKQPALLAHVLCGGIASWVRDELFKDLLWTWPHLNVIPNTALTVCSGCSHFPSENACSWTSDWCSCEIGLQGWRRIKLGCEQDSYLLSAFVAHLGSKASRKFKPLPSLVWCYCVQGVQEGAVSVGLFGHLISVSN